MKKKITLIFLILFIAVLFHTVHISHSRNGFYDIRPYFYSNMFDYVQMTDFLMAHPEISGWAISGSQIQWKETLDGEVPQEITPIVKKLSSTGGIGSVQINLDRTSVLFRGFHNEGRSYIYYSKLPVEDINPEAFEGTLYQRLTKAFA